MSFSLKFLFRSVNAAEERDWERENIRQKTERYLATNPLDRYAKDEPYRQKVDATAAALEGVKGPVLDLGGNTAGEATILAQRGHRIIVADINEYALDVSRQRARKFNLKLPDYVALDAHHIPFADNSFAAVTVLEALHHFADYDRSLSEIHRVLAPGGLLFSIEPNAWNPMRRASEIRDRLRGTIEKSFTRGQLRGLCERAGFVDIQTRSFATKRSEWKLREHPVWRRPISRFNGWICTTWPRIFASHALYARKAGTPPDFDGWDFHTQLRSPIGGNLTFDAARKCWTDTTSGKVFPDLDGIPVLIREDGKAAAS
jgi:ubiquinone/menaquinone biosynthesis C-methylase UbiE